MKKMISAFAAVLAVIMLLSACASADVLPYKAPEPTADETVSPFVGAWRMPPSPFGDDFTCYIVINEDGSFMNVTNLYTSGKTDGPYTQNISTTDDFFWIDLGGRALELHYDYHDDNGEFITTLDYSPSEDALYYYKELYATRDPGFVLLAENDSKN